MKKKTDLKEVEVYKIALKPGDVLMVKVISDEISENDLEQLGKQLRNSFPKNEISVFSLPVGSDIGFSVAEPKKIVDCSVKICDDCSCGKANLNQGDL